MGLFDDLDLKNAEDRPKLVGKFNGVISEGVIQVGSQSNPDQVMLVVTTDVQVSEDTSISMKKWFVIPQGSPSTWDTTERPTKSGKGTTSDFQNNQRARTALKEFFKSLGFGDEVLGSVNEDNIGDLLTNMPVAVTIGEQRGSEYSEIKRFAAIGSSGATLPSAAPAAAPSAPATSAAPAAAAGVVPANNPFAKK